jgi:hypothetical protein
MYRPEFDVRRPQPGDADLAEAIRRGIAQAKLEGELRVLLELLAALTLFGADSEGPP